MHACVCTAAALTLEITPASADFTAAAAAAANGIYEYYFFLLLII
jgi:hypothetical protein